MGIKRYTLLVCLFFVYHSSISQNTFYDTDTIREIRINFYNPDWDYILDSLYVLGNNDRILANLEIDGQIYDSVGVRYKGFSSVSVNRIKNPFNIKLDYIIDDQDHQGIDKLKLSNVIQDPSFIREVLSYEIYRKYMPASEANYANVYINDTLWGLYTNVEAVNKRFLINHFDTKYNPFFKCNPDNLNVIPGGENSNLSNTHGSDSSDYYPYYAIKSDYGWGSLYNLIDTLNNYTDSIHQSLNIDRALWMHALNYTLVNFDSYIGYSQNYYLYKDQANQWNPIIWDLNMSFGGFRLTDASQLYFNGFDIVQAQNMDPLVHYNLISVSPRPLLRNLFDNTRYRKMYLAHIRTITEENFSNLDYLLRGQSLQNLIDSSIQNDTNKFYSYSDFISNLTNQVSLVTSNCPGITQLMDARSTYLSGYKGYSGEPTISNISYLPQNLTLGSDLWINANISNAEYAMIRYRFGNNQRFKSKEMFDDGNHNDGIAGDGIYGCVITNCSNSIDYYLYADNDSAGTFSPKRAANEYYTIQNNISQGDLVINELMSNNINIISDNSGKYEDWIELYNTTSYPISTNGLYLSDTVSNFLKWRLPNHLIPANSYYTIWADEDGHQGENHANFKLSNLGETIILCNKDSTLIDSVIFPSQNSNISYGRTPNGTGTFAMLTPTFNANNNLTNSEREYEDPRLTNVFPNPFQNQIFIDSKEIYTIQDVYGKIIIKSNSMKVNTSSWSTGVYFVHLRNSNQVIKLVKID